MLPLSPAFSPGQKMGRLRDEADTLTITAVTMISIIYPLHAVN